MTDKRYKRYGNVTETARNGGIPSVTFVTHPFRGVTDVTVPGTVSEHGENAHG